MKAEAPEKLYLDATSKCGDTVFTIRNNDTDIEYIRTDAFIEKAADYIANNMRCNGYTLQTKAKFIRDFKKHIKGE